MIRPDGGVSLDEPLPDSVKPESFEEKINIRKILNFITKIHPKYPLQLETLDDVIDTKTLYKMIDAPLDISDYITKVEIFGIDIFKDKKKNNFDTKTKEFLALLSSNHADVTNVNEYLEDYVKN